ncbi:DUF2752 domain-containing protein [Cellulomonas biazotea]|uniref:Membrane protein n=1 Tax=Cellulomonas biazotea TaxID=1709 RepID=A0A402DTA1_9CELL|nr:DUF2752 domain-containing protein [Cellulomonas biazotea]GCE77379.1 membrane protein [Cellulomonas biazotea]
MSEHHAPAAAAHPGHPALPVPSGRPSLGSARSLHWRAAASPLAVAAVSVAGLALVATVDPHTPGRYPTCPLLWLTGLYCPGCGSLRAMHDLAHLDVAAAWGMNPLLLVVLPFLVLAWFAWTRRALLDVPRRRLAHPAWIWAVLAVVLGYAVLRNVPALAPWLAP